MQDRGMAGWSATIILALIGFFNIFGTLGMGYLGTNIKKEFAKYPLFFEGSKYLCLHFSPPSMLNSIIFGVSFGLLWLSTVLQPTE